MADSTGNARLTQTLKRVAACVTVSLLGLMLTGFDCAALSVSVLVPTFLWWGWQYMAAASGLFGVSTVLVFGCGFLVQTASICAAAAVIAVMFRRNSSYRVMVWVLSAILAAVMYLNVLIPAAVQGISSVDFLIAQYGEFFASIGLLADRMNMGAAYMTYIVLASMTFAGLNVVSIYFLSKAGKDKKGGTVKRMSPFQAWALSKSFNTGMITILLCSLTACLINGYNYQWLAAVGVLIIAYPLCVQGVCLITFLGKLGCVFFRSRIVILAAAVLLFPASMVVLFLLGLTEQTMRLRNRVVPL